MVAIPEAAFTVIGYAVETPGPAKVRTVAPYPTTSEYPVDGLVDAIPTPRTIFWRNCPSP